MQEQTKKDITGFRQGIDTCLNSIPAYLQSGREVSLANTALQRSFSWLGECLKAGGSKSPYVESENPSSPVIEPTADHAEGSVINEMASVGASQVARVKLFRSVLQDQITRLHAFKVNGESCGFEYDMCLTEAYVSLKDAKIWFGWELVRLSKLPQ